MQPEPSGILGQADRTVSPEPLEVKPQTTKAHKRMGSYPLHCSFAASRTDVPERPLTAPRSGSTDTNGSTPQTEVTEYPWSPSTAPTSVAITPARTSQRTSSHMRQSGSGSSSAPKLLAPDADWMRHELEKHRRAQDEARAQQELEDQVVASLNAEVRPSHTGRAASAPSTTTSAAVPVPLKSTSLQTQVPAATSIPRRKPVPRSSTDSRQSVVDPQADIGRNNSIARRDSQKQRSTPRSESQQELGILSRSSSRAKTSTYQTPNDSRLSFSHISTQSFSHSFSQKPYEPENEVPQTPSRSTSISHQIGGFDTPGSRFGSRKGSTDISRSGSRSRSIDSIRSAVSSLAPSFSSARGKFRKWRSFHRYQESESEQASRASTSHSDVRGRTSDREERQTAQQQKSKPPINLNRELPPLPSLNMWKPAEPEPPKSPKPPKQPKQKPKHIASLSIGSNGSAGRREKAALKPPPNASESQTNIADAPVSPISLQSSNYPFKIRGVQSSRDPLLGDIPVGLMVAPSGRHVPQTRNSARYSLPVSPVTPSEFKEPPVVNDSNVVDHSRLAAGPNTPNIGRKLSQRAVTAPTMGHARTPSDSVTNFSRKLSSDEYGPKNDARFQNMVEIKPTKSRDGKPLPVATEDKRKKKWWRPGKPKREKTWMDDVVRSGSHSGMILTDDVAGSPVVKF